jgi:predicted metal-dependent HD superfamily phosphohydrolase
MYDLDRLASKWQQCWIDSSIPTSDRTRYDGRAIELAWEQLVAAYTQPDRHYHNLNHIHHLLKTIARFDHLLENPLAISLAAWFHDYVYDSQAADNELQSAKAAGELLAKIGASGDLIDRVQQLIMATQRHQIAAEDGDLCMFLDADLAILGADPDRYQTYARSIRREYSWVPDAEYRAGRIRVLTSFLQRDRLYHTKLLFSELEAIARFNIQQEINILIIN